MSRKSKRRRNRFGPAAVPGAIESAAFEFVDDRTAGATAADFVVAGSEAEATALEAPAVPEAAAATPAAGATETKSAPAVPMAAPAAAPVVVQRTLGETLIAAREARGLTLEEASARTRISIPTLRNLEGDRFEAMAAAAYARGFLRSYGAFLRLDVGGLLQQYEKLTGTAVETAVPESWEPEVRRSESALPRWAMWVAAVMGIVVVAGGVVYGVRSRQSAGTGGDLKQIEAELRAAQTETPTFTAIAPAPAAVEAPSPAALPATLNAIHTAAPIAPAEDTSAPVHETQAAASAGSSRGVVTDMVQVATPPPPEESTATTAAPAPALVAAANPAGATDDAGLAPADGLVLTVTARDSCSMRLQIDADARHAQRYRFAHVGETRSWSARRSFRVLAQRAAHLEVRLNGKLVRVPEGRTLVLDRATLEPAAARPARRAHKPRSSRVAPAPAPATATSPAAITPAELPRYHSSGPPPR